MNSEKIWGLLLEKQLVTGEQPENQEAFIPWYIRFIQGFAGWLAALFLLGFMATAFAILFKKPSGAALLLVGVLFSVVAHFVIRAKNSDFFSQLALAFSLCGQLLVAFGFVFQFKMDLHVSFFLLGVYQLFLAWKIQHYTHRLLTTSFALFALLIALNSFGFYGFSSALIAVLFSFIWLKEIQWKQKRDVWEPIGYGVAITIVFSSGFLLTGKLLLQETVRSKTGWLFTNAEMISSFLISLVFLNLVLVLLKENKVSVQSRTGLISLVAAALLALVSFKIYGISTGILVTVLGFARQRKALITLGGLAVIAFFSWYYYNLQTTLLIKSIVLLVLGGGLLLVWFALRQIYEHKSQFNIEAKLVMPTRSKFIAIMTVFIALIAINVNISKKQDLLKNGDKLLFSLAPADPRSLMQGDYMRIRFDIAAEINQIVRDKYKNTKIPAQQGFAIVEKGENDVAHFIKLDDGSSTLSDNQYLIPYKFRNYRIVFTTNAFYFQEGRASHFQQAKYGEFRIKEGEMLLANMVNDKFEVL